MTIKILDEPLTRLRGERTDKWSGKTKNDAVVKLLFWGDEVDLVRVKDATDPTVRDVRVRYHDYYSDSIKTGFIRKRKIGKTIVPLKLRKNKDYLLELLFVDVQQGDAAIIQTPDRKLLLVDGGEYAMIARALKSLFPHSGKEQTPLDVHALIVTHGDADHFKGLIDIADARDLTDHRKMFAQVHRYFHNGLVKGPSSVSANNRFGNAITRDGERYILDLWTDPRDAIVKNNTFQDWDEALTKMLAPDAEVDRLEYRKDSAFDFLREGGVNVQVLGPIVEPDPVKGRPSLPFLRTPEGGKSVGHTINGHSAVLRIQYGNVNILMGGDLNHDAEYRVSKVVAEDPDRTLRSEILKVPHHGSHEYDQAFLNEVNPVISVVSSGDENASKEYVHPRANLMAALGKASRGPMPLLFSTEVAAFFAHRGWIDPEQHQTGDDGDLEDLPKSKKKPSFRAFERLVYGAVRIRTDGETIVCAVESANANVKEAYSLVIDIGGNVSHAEPIRPL